MLIMPTPYQAEIERYGVWLPMALPMASRLGLEQMVQTLDIFFIPEIVTLCNGMSRYFRSAIKPNRFTLRHLQAKINNALLLSRQSERPKKMPLLLSNRQE